MTEMNTETALFLQLAEVFSEEKACEVPLHDVTPEGHSGSAQWYVKTRCTHCGKESTVFASCDKFVEVLKNGTVPMICFPCQTYDATFAITLLEKIDQV